MKKELVTIDFRYKDRPKNEDSYENKSKVITIGIYDTFEEAIIEGNKAMEIFEKHFKLNTAYNKKERFGKTNGCFGTATRLITPLAYLQTPFEFSAKITELNYGDVEQNILDVLDADKRYKEWKTERDSDDSNSDN